MKSTGTGTGRMLSYRCPECRRMAFRARGEVPVLVEWKCTRCGEIVEPVPERGLSRGSGSGRPWHRTYRCANCKRTQHCENPPSERTYCVACGTPSLVIVDSTGGEGRGAKEPREARERGPGRSARPE